MRGKRDRTGKGREKGVKSAGGEGEGERRAKKGGDGRGEGRGGAERGAHEKREECDEQQTCSRRVL